MPDVKPQDSAEESNFDKPPAKAAEENKDIDPATKRAIEKPEHPSATPSRKDIDSKFQSPAFYTSLTRWHPGIAYFQFLSGNNFPAEWSPDKRFKNCIEQHLSLYKVCYWNDLIMMCSILTLMGIIATLIAYKTII
ncbi:hypothetical protein ACQX2H_09515 [Corynebacterium diphtheriae]